MNRTHVEPGGPFLERLREPEPLVTVELRPPRADLEGGAGMDAWIDLHTAVRRITRRGRFVFLTDDAVGASEEENLAHLGANLPEGTDPARVVPFLTCKHSLEYCLTYAERAWAMGFRALTVLGGDKSVGAPRCLPHAWQLREKIRARVPGLALGGWANPHRDAGEQARWLADHLDVTEFFLTQVVSHHSAERVAALLEACRDADVQVPGIFGVFYYRSANPGTFRALGDFFPVPAEALSEEFAAGATAEEVCARSVRAVREAGARHLYVSNLGMRRTAATLEGVLERV